jgi:hypothetical protein
MKRRLSRLLASVLRYWPCVQRSKQPPKVHAGLCCLGNSSGDEDRRAMRYWETIADNLNKAGWSLAYVSAVNRQGRTIWIVDAHRDGKHRVMRAEEKLMLNSNLVQGNPAQPIAIVEVPLELGFRSRSLPKGYDGYEVTHNGSNKANEFA